MLPLQPSDELLFQISSNLHQLNHDIPKDLILSQPAAASSDHDKTKKLGTIIMSGKRKSSASARDRDIPKGDDINYRKIMHRDIERQRRQEMSTLHTSLRSLLPLEYLKGKRSMSDHMQEAVNYIKHLQTRIKEKGARRDELKKASDFGSIVLASEDVNSSCSSSSSNPVEVRPCLGGIEIVLDGGSNEEALALSKFLRVLLEEGIPVVNCLSTKVNERLFHTVQAEVKDPWCLNLPELHRKLNSLTTSG